VCDECGADHEIVQAMTDPTLTVCPTCGKPGLRKVFTNVGVVFKGSGFYRTDSRAKADSGAPAKPTPAKSDAPSTSPKTPETKKTDTKPKKDTKTT
jgi:putative FmdB family regulatory protein